MDSEDMHDGRATHLRDQDDRYAATAGAYDLFVAAYRSGQVAALEAVLPCLLPGAGPILDVGAGSGLNSAWVLTHVPDSEIVALEPNQSITVGPNEVVILSSPSAVGGHPRPPGVVLAKQPLSEQKGRSF